MQARHQLDFWLGDWIVKDPHGTVVGQSVIRKVVGGCAVQERYVGRSGYSGESFNIYNESWKKWQQFWIDNRGGVLEFVGDVRGDGMLYQGISQDSLGKTWHRMELKPVEQSSVLQTWEQSRNGGASWDTVFVGYYVGYYLRRNE